MSRPRILFSLPCYNEAENLPYVFKDFEALAKRPDFPFEVEVVVVDDCSKDNTKAVVEEYDGEIKVHYHPHSTNKGLTGGINTSFELFEKDRLSENPALAYGMMDGDNSHSSLFVPSMIERILSGYEVVVASRFQTGSLIRGVSGFRQVLSLGLGMLFKLFRNIPGVRDYSCGYRLYSPSIVKRVKQHFSGDVVEEQSFASMVEILVKCHLLQATCTEVPFILRYDYKLGESKMPFEKTIKDNIRLLNTHLKVDL